MITLLAAGIAFDTATNLLSNPSFEAGIAQAATDWVPYSHREHFRRTDARAWHGRWSLGVTKNDGIPHSAARQTRPGVPGAEYALSAWVNITERAGGEAMIYLEFQDARQKRLGITSAATRRSGTGWQQLVTRAKSPPGTAFVSVLGPYVTGPMTVFYDGFLLTGPEVAGEVARVSGVRVGRVTHQSVDLAWDSTAAECEVDWRPVGSNPWRTIKHVWEKVHNVIQLAPETEYEFRVRAVPQSLLDANGRPKPAPPPPPSGTVKARTGKPQWREWQGLRLGPWQHVDSFPDGVTYPCVESFGGFLWTVECRGGALYLSKLESESKRVLWTREIVPRARRDRGVYQGIPDTEVLDGKLWVMWNRQDTANPAGYEITQSQQLLISWDFAAEKLNEPIIVPPTRPGLGAWEGGIAAWRGRLWTAHLDVWLENGKRRTQIVLRPFDPASGRFGEPVFYKNSPTVYPYGPSVQVWRDKLFLLFSDLAASEKDASHEPLFYVLFDGERFGDARLMQDMGRSRYAKGVALDDGRFILFYKWNGPYLEWGYKFHDLALTLLDPATGVCRTTSYVDDRKYNSSPGCCLHNGRVIVTYGKFEHSYGDPKDPALNHGGFIGEIVPVK
ncbi:MAG: fibronectin type III domain-containing protein [Verrucomicrobiae bacterium]|nr:fibronectin type III domain-containing protein [Verrucomicrobiae bacterium]